MADLAQCFGVEKALTGLVDTGRAARAGQANARRRRPACTTRDADRRRSARSNRLPRRSDRGTRTPPLAPRTARPRTLPPGDGRDHRTMPCRPSEIPADAASSR